MEAWLKVQNIQLSDGSYVLQSICNVTQKWHRNNKKRYFAIVKMFKNYETSLKQISEIIWSFW